MGKKTFEFIYCTVVTALVVGTLFFISKAMDLSEPIRMASFVVLAVIFSFVGLSQWYLKFRKSEKEEEQDEQIQRKLEESR